MGKGRRKGLVQLVGIMLAAVLIIAAVGCGGGSSDNNNAGASGGNSGQSGGQSGKQQSEAPAEQPVELEYALRGVNLPPAGEDFIKRHLDEQLNMDFNLTIFPSEDDLRTAMNVRLAGGDHPDFFIVPNRTQLQAYVEKGLMLDLTPYFDKLGPTIDFVGRSNLKKAEFDGKTYAIVKSPETPSGQLASYWIRTDWLDNVGMSMPTTTEELFDVAIAFTENDPDRNGKKDTYAISGLGMAAFAPIFGAFGSGGPDAFYIKDGEMVHGAHDSGTREALQFIKRLIDAGAVDPEVMTNKGLMHQEKAIQGKAGIAMINWAYMKKVEEEAKFKAVDAKAEWTELPPVSGPGGEKGMPIDIGRTNGFIVIPKAVENNPAKLQKIFDLLNYISEEEGNRLVSYGIEDRHYKVEGDRIVPTELMAKETGYTWMYQITGVDEMPYLYTKFTGLEKHIDFSSTQARAEYYNGYLIAPEAFNPADAGRYFEEELIKFLYGKRSFDEYDDFLKTLDTTFNQQLYTESAKEQLRALGFVQ